MDEKARNRAIRDAIQEGDLGHLTRLIEEKPDALRQMTPFGTWLHVAASFGRIEVARYLIAHGLDINQRGGTFDGNALNLAASSGHRELVEYLLECGAELDTSEPEKNPLFGAIYGGHKAVVALLLNRGIDTSVSYNGQQMQNMDAKAFAKERGQFEIAEIIGRAN